MRKLPFLLTALTLLPLAGHAQDAASTTEYRIDSDASLLRVLAYPDGPLKRFGHHHVISHNGITGTVSVADDPLDSTFELELVVADLDVDDPALRALESEEGFEGEVPQDDIDGTKANMLGEDLLHGDEYPTIRIMSGSIDGELPDVSISATFVVKGVEQTVTIPASIELMDDSFTATGEIELLHEAFGLSQFTAMGGALSVRDLLVLKYEISGVRVPAGD